MYLSKIISEEEWIFKLKLLRSKMYVAITYFSAFLFKVFLW